jgi:methylglutamate dehydrogenase subunit D
VSDFALAPRSGLEHLLLPGTHGAHADAPGVIVTLRTDLALALVIARKGKAEDLRQRVQDRLGVTLPTTPQHAEKGGAPSQDGLNFIWAGPGRWLAGTSAQAAAALEAMLRTELSGLASVMNQSDGRCVFRIGGPSAREVLAQGLPIDIDPRVFGPGDTALTLAGHVNVHFWQVDLSPVYEFAVPRSFAASFYQWLFATSAKYGVSVRSAQPAPTNPIVGQSE